MSTQLAFPGLDPIVKPFRFPATPCEYKIIPLRECPMADDLCDTPQRAADYWRQHIPKHPYFNPEVECMVVLIVNARRRVKGHYLVSIGLQDTILVHAREIFRVAIATSANAVILSHNHPSGDPTPSEADIRVTRDLIRAGQLLKIEVLDHIVTAREKHVSLRELGFFC